MDSDVAVTWVVLPLLVVGLLLVYGGIHFLMRRHMFQAFRAMRWRRSRKLADRIEKISVAVERHDTQVTGTSSAQTARVSAHAVELVAIRDRLDGLSVRCEEHHHRGLTELIPRRALRDLSVELTAVQGAFEELVDEYTRLPEDSQAARDETAGGPS